MLFKSKPPKPNNNKHEYGEEESYSQRSTPLCRRVVGKEERHSHITRKGIAEGNVDAIHPDEKAAQTGRGEFSSIDGRCPLC
jgi:hypothetical protein